MSVFVTAAGDAISERRVSRYTPGLTYDVSTPPTSQYPRFDDDAVDHEQLATPAESKCNTSAENVNDTVTISVEFICCETVRNFQQ